MGENCLEIGQSVPIGTYGLRDHLVRDAFDIWLEMINNAKKSIDIEQFYIASVQNTKMEAILKSIVGATSRGVSVRILVDKYFFERNKTSNNNQYVWWERFISEASDMIAVRMSNIHAITGGIQHSKFFIIDGNTGWVGSQNFDWRALEHIVEIGVFVKCPQIVGELNNIFELDWESSISFTQDPSIYNNKHHTWKQCDYCGEIHKIKIVSSPGTREGSHEGEQLLAITDLISQARNSIAIQTRKYTTVHRTAGSPNWNTLDSALRSAADRDIKIRLLVDGSGSVRPDLASNEIWRRLASVKNIEVCTISIPPYGDDDIPFARMLHSKMLIIDANACWIGSANWDPENFLNNRNVGIVVEGGFFFC